MKSWKILDRFFIVHNSHSLFLKRICIYTVLITPTFYTFIIFPFYKDIGDYKEFLFLNSIFWIFTFIFFYLFIKVNFLPIYIKNVSLSKKRLILANTYILFYFMYNVLTYGNIFDGCHYCGAILELGNLWIITVFDLGVAVVILNIIELIFYRRLKFSLLKAAVVLLIIYYIVDGAYRNQLLPIVSLFLILISAYIKRLFVFMAFFILYPLFGMFMSYYHYFLRSNTSYMSFIEFFSTNEFVSNYNNYIGYLNGFNTERITYFDFFMLQIKYLTGTDWKTVSQEFAEFMWSSGGIEGVGYGFSPLVEALVNFGDFYLFSTILIGFVIALVFKFTFLFDDPLLRIILSAVFMYFIFNINRIDFSTALNIYIHKVFFILLLFNILNAKISINRDRI